MKDFFKNKFNKFDDSDGIWHRPDENVRMDLLEKISSPAKPTYISSNLFWKIAFIIAMLLVGGYIWHLRKSNTELKNTLQAQNERIEKLESELLNQENIKEENTSAQILATEELENKNQELIIQNQKLSDDINIQETIIAKINREKSELHKTVAFTSTVSANEVETPKTAPNIPEYSPEEINPSTSPQNIYPISLQPFEIKAPQLTKSNQATEPYKTALPENIDPIKPMHRKYEVGYEYALIGHDIPVERKFERQRPFTRNIESRKVNVNSNGAYFAYSPKKNWWIRTGVRIANMDIRRKFDMALIYDKEKERPNPDGGRSNQLALTTSTPYTETESSFDVTFEEGRELDDGDFLKLTINDSQHFNYIQVPIGVEYFYGTGKLQWLFQGGLQWNRIGVGEYSFAVSSEAKDGEIIIERKKVISKNIPAKHFLGTYAGLGLDYQLLNNLHVRASFNLNHNFNKNNKSDFAASSKTGTALRMGLNYRF